MWCLEAALPSIQSLQNGEGKVQAKKLSIFYLSPSPEHEVPAVVTLGLKVAATWAPWGVFASLGPTWRAGYLKLAWKVAVVRGILSVCFDESPAMGRRAVTGRTPRRSLAHHSPEILCAFVLHEEA